MNGDQPVLRHCAVTILVGLAVLAPATGASAASVALCPVDRIVSGFAVGVETYVDRIAPMCRDADGSVVRGPMIAAAGASGTPVLRSSCPFTPAVAVGLYGRSGDVVDAVGARCRRTDGSVDDAPLRGGDGGEWRGPFDCPRAKRLIGLEGTVTPDYFGSAAVTSIRGVCEGRRTTGGRVGGSGGALAVSGYQTLDGRERVSFLADGALREFVWSPAGAVRRARIADLPGAIDLGGYETPDGVQHAITARMSGGIDDVRWSPRLPLAPVALASVPLVTRVSAFRTSDGDEHAVFLTWSGQLGELRWAPGSAVQRVLLTQVPYALDVAGYQSAENADGIRHAIVANQEGEIHEIWWRRDSEQVTDVEIGRIPGVTHVSGFETPDGVQHVFALARSGGVTELYWHPSQDVHRAAIGRVPLGVDIAGYATADGIMHAIVARSSRHVVELWWPPGNPAREQDLTTGAEIPAGS